MTSSIALALLATLSAPQPESARVPGFLPTRNGFHFDNNRWPPAPNYTISVLGHQFRLGKASDGLCGGMVFAVQDLFRAGAPAPADTTPPDPGAPLFNYIVGSLTRSFTAENVWRFFDWIQLGDSSSTFTTGVCHRMILEEWPAIKADIDGRRLSPIGLVRGRETPLDFAATFRDLSKCHQVLAWGYDVSGTSVTLRIYDPNFLADDRTIAFDTGDPERASVTVTGYDGDPFRAFFRESYAYHDPRTPLEYKLAGANVVSSPGIAR